MVDGVQSDLLPRINTWLQAESAVCSAVLFGSRARDPYSLAAADGHSDIDLHVVSNSVDRVLATDWSRAVRGSDFCLQVLRPASGGIRKVTVIFDNGEVDIVLVRSVEMRMASFAMHLGLHRRLQFVETPLNIFATIMAGGYRFLKGQGKWGSLYARVVAEMRGCRLSDAEVRRMADAFLCDMLWILRKLGRGELVASQRTLHRSLHETNVLLLHELRMRRSEITFQQARRIEKLVTANQLPTVIVNAQLDRSEIAAAAWGLREGLDVLMRELVPSWHAPKGLTELLVQQTPTPAR